MNIQRGFASLGIVLAILFGVIVLGGGAYFVMQQSSSQTTSDTNLDTLQTLPTNNDQTQQDQPTKETPAQTNPSETFTATPSSGTAPLTVRFAQTATDDWRAAIDYGDGTSCAQEQPNESQHCSKFTHVYASPGTYTASLISTTGTDGATRPPLGRITVTVKAPESVSQNVSVPGMTKYTDTDFGFSFWYPSAWRVTKHHSGSSPDSEMEIDGIEPPFGDTSRQFFLLEHNSRDGANYSFGKAFGRIYFDALKHQWMDQNNWDPRQGLGNYPAIPADVSINTMGGLHIFADSIVPLSASHFVIMNTGGSADPAYLLLKTILASDASVATPLSAAQQTVIIQAEQNAYGI